jgi:uncharacterized lipoprotein
MLKKSINLFAASLLLGGVAACDVDKTKEGDVTLPKYDVKKTQDGNVTAPQYEVTPPDVTVTKEQKTVEVPTVRTEERQVTVPDVDVKPAPDK